MSNQTVNNDQVNVAQLLLQAKCAGYDIIVHETYFQICDDFQSVEATAEELAETLQGILERLDIGARQW